MRKRIMRSLVMILCHLLDHPMFDNADKYNSKSCLCHRRYMEKNLW